MARQYWPQLVRAPQARHPGGLVAAEDIAQETLLRAFRKLDQYDARFSFRTWLFTIAFRISTDELRRPKLVQAPLDGVELAEGCFCFRTDCPAEKIEQQEEANNIWSVARRVLNQSQFTAMWLCYAEEFSYAEIAAMMGKSQVSVRVILYRAKSKLLEAIHHSPARNVLDDQTGEEAS